MKHIITTLIFVIACGHASAGYNANMRGVVTHVLTYTQDGRVYFRLDNQPGSHPACSTDYFSIDASVEPNVRQQLLSRLMIAYATGESVNVGYDDESDCSHSRIRVHRVG